MSPPSRALLKPPTPLVAFERAKGKWTRRERLCIALGRNNALAPSWGNLLSKVTIYHAIWIPSLYIPPILGLAKTFAEPLKPALRVRERARVRDRGWT